MMRGERLAPGEGCVVSDWVERLAVGQERAGKGGSWQKLVVEQSGAARLGSDIGCGTQLDLGKS